MEVKTFCKENNCTLSGPRDGFILKPISFAIRYRREKLQHRVLSSFLKTEPTNANKIQFTAHMQGPIYIKSKILREFAGKCDL